MGPWGKGVVTAMHDGEHVVPCARAYAVHHVPSLHSCRNVALLRSRYIRVSPSLVGPWDNGPMHA